MSLDDKKYVGIQLSFVLGKCYFSLDMNHAGKTANKISKKYCQYRKRYVHGAVSMITQL